MRIAILAIPGVQMLDVAGPMDIFAEANRHIRGKDAYQQQIVGLTLGTVTADNGTRISPDASIATANEPIDTLLIAGSPTVRNYADHRPLLDWILARARRVRRIGSICTGAFLLGHAGLLDGRRVTTHWNSTKHLAETFPKVKVEANQIYVRDGPIYTSAGVTASMDLALALVEEDHGRDIALRVAKELILFLKRPGGQSQFSMQLAAQVSRGSPIGNIHEWILGHLEQDLSVEALASHLGMSARNFSRLFKRTSGMTPGDYVRAARVDAARRMLEECDESLKMVAGSCGFPDYGALRRAFAQTLNVTPAEYRQRFRPARRPKHQTLQ